VTPKRAPVILRLPISLPGSFQFVYLTLYSVITVNFIIVSDLNIIPLLQLADHFLQNLHSSLANIVARETR